MGNVLIQEIDLFIPFYLKLGKHKITNLVQCTSKYKSSIGQISYNLPASINLI